VEKSLKVVKSVSQPFVPSEEVLGVFSKFKEMVNHAIRVGVEKNVSSRFKLSNEVYDSLRNDLHSWYVLGAVEKASGILKNYRTVKRKNDNTKTPYVKRNFIILGNQAFKIIEGKLRMHIGSRSFIDIPLNDYVLKVLSDKSVKIGELVLTDKTLSISYSKQIYLIESVDVIGIDRNLNNATTASSQEINVYNLSKATRIKNVYKKVKSHFKRNDCRIRKKIFQKYGLKQKRRENQLLHRVSKKIVEKAFNEKASIALENIKGIRKLYRKGNGQGKKYRGKLNGWSFSKLANFIQYKANWLGLSVDYVNARNTSNLCATCGSKIIECAGRKVFCKNCFNKSDRDVNAALNIRTRGLRLEPDGKAVEAMVTERYDPSKRRVNPFSRCLSA
jgi:putative transposase